MYKHVILNLIGTIPDKVIPSSSETFDKGIDCVFIYFRNDGSLYAYDTELKQEFNLFEL